jgi:hypothetical protein
MGVTEIAVVGQGLLAKQLIGPAGHQRRNVRESLPHTRIEDRAPCAFDSEHTSKVKKPEILPRTWRQLSPAKECVTFVGKLRRGNFNLKK